LKVAVVGAGVAGLGAARTLTEHGHEAVVLEKASRVGGRVSTVRIDGYVFDSGATSISPDNTPLATLMRETLDHSDLVEITKPVNVHTVDRIVHGDPARGGHRFAYGKGIDELPRLLAHGLDVHLNTRVEKITREDHHYRVGDDLYDAVIVTAPLPQAIELVGTVRPALGPGRATHRSCISVMLGFEEALETPHFATVNPDQNLPMVWLSVESVKSPGRAPEGCTAMVAQMGPAYSRYGFHYDDERIVRETLVDVSRIYGMRFAKPVVTQVKRWKFSQPEITVAPESVNPAGSRVIIAGDGVSIGRIEQAYLSGVHAAQRLGDLK
jgi:predicted NAD/FAD-dependent oxidoreductase